MIIYMSGYFIVKELVRSCHICPGINCQARALAFIFVPQAWQLQAGSTILPANNCYSQPEFLIAHTWNTVEPYQKVFTLKHDSEYHHPSLYQAVCKRTLDTSPRV